MFNNKYLVRIEGKNPHRFFLSLVKMHLEFLQVKEENDYSYQIATPEKAL